MNILKLSWWEKVLVKQVVNFLTALQARVTNQAEKIALQFVLGFLQAIMAGTVAADAPPMGLEAGEEFELPRMAAPSTTLNFIEVFLLEGVTGFLEEWISSANITNPIVMQAVAYTVEFLQALISNQPPPTPPAADPLAPEFAPPKPFAPPVVPPVKPAPVVPPAKGTPEPPPVKPAA